MKVFEGVNTHIKCWCNEPEEGAIKQATNLSALPFLHKHVALMPDTHEGYGMPIGGVIATIGVVIPNAVGVDIGCGMCAVKTSLTEMSQEEIKKIFGGSKENKGGIRSCVPVGFSHHSKKQDENLMPEKPYRNGDNYSLWLKHEGYDIVSEEYESALKQIGTLGGGNHFIEIQKGDDGHIWIMLHSGSRNLGYKVANHYNKIAKDLNEKWYSSVPKEHDLAFLPIDSMGGKAYLREMKYCLDFAKANRAAMMINICDVFNEHYPGIEMDSGIDVHHNYATMEHHFDKNVMIHRKGATSAKTDQLGIIPGSQGTASYIVRGKGNRDSFTSCSHGAGRAMGRKQAQRELSVENEIKILEDQGILHSIRTEKDLDEASSAYKNIDIVMEEQNDLVDIVVKLKPLAVIKG